MIDFKIRAVLNPKGKTSREGEAIFICINKKVRQYINLGLEKIPKKAWTGRPLKWVNKNYPYFESHNQEIAKAIHDLKVIIQDYYRRNEVITAEKLKKVYEVKYLGKRHNGVSGDLAPGASDSITDYFDFYLKSDRSSDLKPNTKKVYHTTIKKLKAFRPHATMSDLNEEFVKSFVAFLKSENLKDNSFEKYVQKLRKIYAEYCDQYEIAFKTRYFDNLDINATRRAERIVYLNRRHYKDLINLKFSPKERRQEITRDIFLFMCNTSLYYNDLKRLVSKTAFDEKLLKLDKEYIVLHGKRIKNNEDFWIPLNSTAKRIFKKYYCPDCMNVFPASILISEQKFNASLKQLSERINFSDNLTIIVARKTFATWAHEIGLPEPDIKMMFGHSPGSVVKKHYTERKTLNTYNRILNFIEQNRDEKEK